MARVPPNVFHACALSEDWFVTCGTDSLHCAVEAFFANEAVFVNTAGLDVKLTWAVGALETVGEMDEVFLAAEEELAVLKCWNDWAVASEALWEIVLESIETFAAVRKAVESDESLHCLVSVAASHTRETGWVEMSPNCLDTLLWVDELAAFCASLAEALLVALLVENEVVFDNALQAIEWLTAKTAAETVGMPVVTGECDLGFVDFCLTAGTHAWGCVGHVPQSTRWVVRLDCDDVGKRQKLA